MTKKVFLKKSRTQVDKSSSDDDDDDDDDDTNSQFSFDISEEDKMQSPKTLETDKQLMPRTRNS